ncbi:N-(5'-phosphoribosyl)anthranilate isomerase [Natrialba magadii ATCC 43099]|uniref:N-(5'-phosphoribosyl)anthranilate isomerase n=1 Tax=Natrialba magadii (strain ATCC 43099 / DSM 3394 / CCM 3739 / CIP 104546 / IAM 13178 / JCM 8861 / NBRC 102185 / NCIMB 2190 / MS3) TaxID=547559 RepID=D3SVU3_NATMM|nr:phosphoribosylanthranilate isomerase [Natrialba magadii]ADD03662.1 N-(5'-phosphoribosyl)anthranilate isomerase [Natrialba magadii ATCC 43099]ELY34428.1 phosphoribosylanthranilate isomerase [Natrialba magadii ATCC 43099]
MTRVKICGLTNADDLQTAVDAGADAVGVICDVPVDSPREVAVQEARDLVANVPPFVTSVLVTMPETPAAAAELAATVEPDALQIHGSLEPAALESVREQTSTELIYAVDSQAVDEAEDAAAAADALLVDSTDEDGGGGTGETHDWERTRDLVAALETPVILAGGLTPANVTEAVQTVEPFAVDVASGVEATGGVKDTDAVRSFVERASCTNREAPAQPHPYHTTHD